VLPCGCIPQCSHTQHAATSEAPHSQLHTRAAQTIWLPVMQLHPTTDYESPRAAPRAAQRLWKHTHAHHAVRQHHSCLCITAALRCGMHAQPPCGGWLASWCCCCCVSLPPCYSAYLLTLHLATAGLTATANLLSHVALCIRCHITVQCSCCAAALASCCSNALTTRMRRC
jgi:hypothetical protein